MLFPAFSFFLFFIVVLTLSWYLKRKPFLWRVFLLISSYFFYANWDIRLLLLLIFVSIFNFYSGLALEKIINVKKKRIILLSAIGIDVFVLSVFKYFDFFQNSVVEVLARVGLGSNFTFLHLILPVGLSFYILRAISYNIDIFRQKYRPESSLLDFSIYIAFFPQLLSGPIMRADEFLPQVKNGGTKNIDNLYENFALILSGLFKKVVIASYLTVNLVDNVFSVPENHSQLAVMLAIYAYAIVIYCDFSGYSDMAVGFAGLLGFKSPVNFNSPYLAKDFQDFWRRWHMTFSGWLRDYVYIPLGGNRKGKLRTYFNLMITMFVSGLWHGTGLHFIFWGIGHGLGLAVSHFKAEILKNSPLSGSKKTLENILSWFITLNSVCFLWIFFRAENTQGSLAIIKQLLNWNSVVEPIEDYSIYMIVFSFILFALGSKLKNAFILLERRLPLALQILSIAFFVIILIKLGPDIIPPFIYFKF